MRAPSARGERRSALQVPPVSWDDDAIVLDAIDQAPEQTQPGMCPALRAQVAL